MDKIQSRRFKKLRHRAEKKDKSPFNHTAGRISGIQTFMDADELLELMKGQARMHHKSHKEEKQQSSTKEEGEEESVASPYYISLHTTSTESSSATTTTNDESMMDSNQWKVVDVTNHRDLLLSLLLHHGQESTNMKKKKKKKQQQREDQDMAIPSVAIPNWIRIHNPVLLRNIAVLEFNIDSDGQNSVDIQQQQQQQQKDTSCIHIMPSTRCRNERRRKEVVQPMSHQPDDNNNQSCNYSTITKLLLGKEYPERTIIPFKTQIQGQPKSITDSLMYIHMNHTELLEPTSLSSKSSWTHTTEPCETEKSCTTHSNTILSTMYQILRLTDTELLDEGFPLPKDHKTSSSSSSIATTKKHSCLLRLENISSMWDENVTIDLYQTLPLQGEESLQIVQELSIDVMGDDRNELLSAHEPEKNNKMYISSCLSREGGRLGAKAFAIDCEMVQTYHGLELARVTVLRFDPTNINHYIKVLDSFVKPAAKIIDYKTEYSGITAKMLLHVTTQLEDIQATLASLIFKDDIIIGHSLENDLSVLRFSHGNIVDTSVLFRGDDNRKMSLRYLSKVLLQRQIQSSSDSIGHDSVEDAAASLHLAIHRARIGPTFRLKRKGTAGKINILECIQNISKVCQDRVCSRIRDIVALVGPKTWIHQHVSSQSSAHALSCESIDDSTVNALNSWFKASQRKASIIWASLNVDGSNAPSSNQKIDAILSKALTYSPLDTVILVIFQRGYQRTAAISKQKTVAKNPRSTLGWTSVQEDALNRHIDHSEWAEAFWISKA